MSTTETTTTAEEQNYTLRFEATVRWDRPLTEPQDNPERLKERLSKIPVKGDVSVTEFSDTSATVLVETRPERMNHSVALIAQKIRKVIRSYNSRVIDGDDLNKVPTPYGKNLKKKHIRWAYEGRELNQISEYIPPETWEIAQEKAEGLDLEGAPSLEPTIETRTLEA